MWLGRISPPTYLGVAVLLMIGLRVVWPVRRIVPWPWNLLGLGPILVGAWLNLWADWQFKRAGTTVKPFQPSSALVTTGAFRLSRHPMYVGMTAILVGLAVCLATLTPMVVVPVFVLVAAAIFVPAEERMLKEQFGQEYRDYRRRVRRWL